MDVNIVFYMLPYACSVTNDILCMRMFTESPMEKKIFFACAFKSFVTRLFFVSYERLCII